MRRAAAGPSPPARRCFATALFLYYSAYACLVVPLVCLLRRCVRDASASLRCLLSAHQRLQRACCRLSSASQHPAARRRTRATQSSAGTARERRRGCAPPARIAAPLSSPPFTHVSFITPLDSMAATRAFAAAATAALLLAGGAAATNQPNGGKGISFIKGSVGGGGWTEGCVSGGAAPSAQCLQRRGALGAAVSGARRAGAVGSFSGRNSGAGLRARARVSAPRVRAARAYLPRSQACARRRGIRVTDGSADIRIVPPWLPLRLPQARCRRRWPRRRLGRAAARQQRPRRPAMCADTRR